MTPAGRREEVGFPVNCYLTMLTFRQFLVRLGKASPLVFVAGIAMAPVHALAVTTWNWSFSTVIAEQFGSGTFTTADVVPATGTMYPITGISGTYNRGGTAYTIDGLDFGADNRFAWDGTGASPILAQGGGGFAFRATSGGSTYFVNVGRVGLGFGAVLRIFSSFPGADGDIVSSRLSPGVSSFGLSDAASEVPGPLPLLGAAAAFKSSRHLRRRLNRPSQKV